MRHNRIKLWVLGLLFVTLAGLGGIGALMRPRIEPDQRLHARFGDVVWSHASHARMQEINSCQVCHHKEKQNVVHPKPCESCHQPLDLDKTQKQKTLNGQPTPPSMTVYHGKCIGCHRALKKGPMVCRDCHMQTFHGPSGTVRWNHRSHARKIDMGTGDNPQDACLLCHHKDRKAETEGDYRACRACHKPVKILGLKYRTQVDFHQNLNHKNCKECHVQGDPSDGVRTCKDCHSGLKVDLETKTPPIEQAVHARCLACHNIENQNLDPGMPNRCDDCHRPDPSVIADVGVGILFWDHDRHVEYADGIKCDTCHHTDQAEGPHMACNKCHGSGLYENPTLVQALRKLCIECHQEKHNGLVSWDKLVQNWNVTKMFEVQTREGKFYWSHREHAISWSFSCRNCHHPRSAKEGRPNDSTQTESGLRDKDRSPESCRNCHTLYKAPKTRDDYIVDTRPSTFVEVLKKVCLKCHNSLGGGPQAWSDFFKENMR